MCHVSVVHAWSLSAVLPGWMDTGTGIRVHVGTMDTGTGGRSSDRYVDDTTASTARLGHHGCLGHGTLPCLRMTVLTEIHPSCTSPQSHGLVGSRCPLGTVNEWGLEPRMVHSENIRLLIIYRNALKWSSPVRAAGALIACNPHGSMSKSQ